MPTRDKSPQGAPCWVDLWTSDVEGSRKFYADLFGWEALEPSPEFGGYFMFTREGVPVAGGMGDMGDLRAQNLWKVYLNTDDLTAALELAGGLGAEITSPSMPVADLGRQAVLNDPTGAQVGSWEPGTFPGFTVVSEHGAPSWFELHTSDFSAALAFYEQVFHWKTSVVSDTDDLRYAVMANPDGEGELAGVFDASRSLAGRPSNWNVYWHVDDAKRTAARAKELGGAVVDDPADTPYGTMATLADPAGAQFKLRTPPS